MTGRVNAVDLADPAYIRAQADRYGRGVTSGTISCLLAAAERIEAQNRILAAIEEYITDTRQHAEVIGSATLHFVAEELHELLHPTGHAEKVEP